MGELCSHNQRPESGGRRGLAENKRRIKSKKKEKKKKKELNKKKKQVSQINLINQNTQEKNNTAKQIPFFFFSSPGPTKSWLVLFCFEMPRPSWTNKVLIFRLLPDQAYLKSWTIGRSGSEIQKVSNQTWWRNLQKTQTLIWKCNIWKRWGLLLNTHAHICPVKHLLCLGLFSLPLHTFTHKSSSSSLLLYTTLFVTFKKY